MYVHADKCWKRETCSVYVVLKYEFIFIDNTNRVRLCVNHCISFCQKCCWRLLGILELNVYVKRLAC